MKILVDEMPRKPSECIFVKWNCEYGYLCSFKQKREAVFCEDTTVCPFLKIDAEG